MLSRANRKQIRALASRREREREGLFLAEGIRVVEELLDGGIVLHTAVVSSSLKDTDRGARLAERLAGRTDVQRTGDGELKRLAATRTPQGVLVVAETPHTPLDAITPSADSLVLVLDGVQDPGNLGTLARAAAAFGSAGLIALPGTVDPWNPKAVRASAGSLFRLPVVQAGWPELDRWRAERPMQMLGADATGRPVDRIGEEEWVALAVGNEGAGLSPEARERCDRLVAVPMRSGVESLNVAVAGGILLYALTRRAG